MTIVDRRYSVAEGTAVKAPCHAATTANITLIGQQTIDGVAVVEGDRVLVKSQTNGVDNGIYTASTGNWSRARDFDGAYDIVHGTRIFVTNGTANGGAEFVVSTSDPITIGATSIAFTSIIATAIASAAAAAASASAASTSASSASTSASAASTSATAAAASAVLAASYPAMFGTRALAQAATVGTTIPMISVAGYTVRGDAPIAWFVRTASQPIHEGKIQTADGAWWVITGPDIWPEQFGAKGDGVTNDQTAIMNAETCRFLLSEPFYSDTIANAGRTPAVLNFMAKQYYMDNPDQWKVLRPQWQGATNNGTVIIMDGPSTISIWLEGSGTILARAFNGYTSGYIRDLTLWAPVTRTTGQALRLDGGATYQPDEFNATNLKITGASGSGWDIPLYLNGIDRASPLGVRFCVFNNLFLGQPISAALFAQTAVQLTINGGGSYGLGSGGGANATQIQISGTALAKSTDLCITNFKCNSLLNIDYTTGGSVHINTGGVTLGANALKVSVMGSASGVVTNSGTSCNIAALA